MNKLVQSVKQFMSNEEGVTAVEYALVLAFMAAAIVLAWPTLTNAFDGLFTSIAAELSIAK